MAHISSPVPGFLVVVAGGGMVGLAAALAVHRLGRGRIDVTILDPNFAQRQVNDARASALTAGSRRMLDALGVWEDIAPHAQPVTAMDISDAHLDQVLRPVFLSFGDDAATTEPFAHIVPNDVVHNALLKRVTEAGMVCLATGVKSAVPFPNGIHITPLSGDAFDAAFLIAADGAHSRIRQRAGIADYSWSYDRTAIVTTIAHSLDHQGRARQHFLNGGPFALLPLTGQRSSIVWTEPHKEAQRIMALPDDAFTAELALRAGGFAGDIHLAGPRAAHPLSLRMARTFIGNRLALAGDAAHGLHPVAGQGVNLGFRDVAALAECVGDAVELGGNPGVSQVLKRYEQWRRFDTLVMLAATDGLVRLFARQSPPLRLLRDIGLGLVDRAPWLKNALIRSAAGASGHPPKLLRGELP
jgi:2-octaprenyl-6-methoxyphenol hydroxylase